MFENRGERRASSRCIGEVWSERRVHQLLLTFEIKDYHRKLQVPHDSGLSPVRTAVIEPETAECEAVSATALRRGCVANIKTLNFK